LLHSLHCVGGIRELQTSLRTRTIQSKYNQFFTKTTPYFDRETAEVGQRGTYIIFFKKCLIKMLSKTAKRHMEE
jgi:uncharacterized FlgJ-related protein